MCWYVSVPVQNTTDNNTLPSNPDYEYKHWIVLPQNREMGVSRERACGNVVRKTDCYMIMSWHIDAFKLVTLSHCWSHGASYA